MKYQAPTVTVEYDYLSGRVYITSNDGMRVAITGGRKTGLRELEIIVEALTSFMEHYKS